MKKKHTICLFMVCLLFLCSNYLAVAGVIETQDIKWSVMFGEKDRIAEEKVPVEEILNTGGLYAGQNFCHTCRSAGKIPGFFWNFLSICSFVPVVIKKVSDISFFKEPRLHENKKILQYIHDMDGKK